MATSKLQISVGNLLDKVFPQYHILENYRPEWLRSSNLTKLELDFYIEELRIAFEIQGDQHYQYTPLFHKSYEDFLKQKQYDKEKQDLCDGSGIKLYEILTEQDALILVSEISKIDLHLPTKREILDARNINRSRLNGFDFWGSTTILMLENDATPEEWREYEQLKTRFKRYKKQILKHWRTDKFGFEFNVIQSPLKENLIAEINKKSKSIRF